MAEEATYFYFTHYRQHWCSKHLSDALACIPQVMMSDDHDIFDGWGSYPHALLTCTVFQGTHSVTPHKDAVQLVCLLPREKLIYSRDALRTART